MNIQAFVNPKLKDNYGSIVLKYRLTLKVLFLTVCFMWPIILRQLYLSGFHLSHILAENSTKTFEFFQGSFSSCAKLSKKLLSTLLTTNLHEEKSGGLSFGDLGLQCCQPHLSTLKFG